jgi:Ni/Fe-hydrogenase subunit HybB-like protein
MAFEENVQLFSILGIPLAILTAVYTAFLFAQAEGRDLWQSPLLSFHLLVQAIMAGAAMLAITYPLFNFAPMMTGWLFIISLLINLLLTLGGEFAVPHASQVAATAAHIITKGRYKTWYWFSIIGGMILPLALVLLFSNLPIMLALAGAFSIAGLFAYEWAFVMAPQQVPNN